MHVWKRIWQKTPTYCGTLWQRLGSHHGGATEGGDSQELQGYRQMRENQEDLYLKKKKKKKGGVDKKKSWSSSTGLT